MQHASIATIQEVSVCCKLILMFCVNASYKTGFLHTSQRCFALVAHSFAFL